MNKGQFIKGHLPLYSPLGLKLSEETKLKISIAHKGRPCTEEAKRKESESKKGKLRGPYQKKKGLM